MMTNNELFTHCSKLINSINFSELVNERFTEAIKNGDLQKANEQGTSHCLPQLIVYSTLAQYVEQFRKTLPSRLTESERLRPVL